MSNHCIYYDKDCMMCSLYTSAMLRSGVLAKDGRRVYQDLAKTDSEMIDKDRARNEIALIDEQTGKVSYGVDSFLTLFAAKWPSLAPLFKSRVVRVIATPIYKFISFNRKVISPPNVFEAEGSCTPDFHMGYRSAYILVTWAATAMLLLAFSALLSPMLPESTWGREFLICGGQLLFQAALVLTFAKAKVMEYLGNMMTISMVGALALVPILLIDFVLDLAPFAAAVMFFGVVFMMFLEHIRRVKYLGLPVWLTATWVLYRVLVLMLIL